MEYCLYSCGIFMFYGRQSGGGTLTIFMYYGVNIWCVRESPDLFSGGMEYIYGMKFEYTKPISQKQEVVYSVL